MNAPRAAGRAAKDRPNTKLSNVISQNKTSQVSISLLTNDSDKSSENFNPKIQPTAEQMRIAQIINDGNRNEDPDIQNKIEQVMELTKKSRDEVQIALHDCDNDPERAALLLLEGFQEVEAKWERSVKRKKNRQQQTSKSEETNGIDGSNSNHNKENREQSGEGSTGKEVRFQDGPKKSRGPPRMNRGASGSGGGGGGGGGNWRNKENEKNEKNAEESTSGGRRERDGNRSRGRKTGRGSRSRGGGGSEGNARSNGGRSRTFQNKSLTNSNSVNGSNEGNGSASNNGGGFPPSIEMWNNNTPAEQNTTMNVGNWSDFTASEDWGEEDWTGNLETTVYTPSSSSSSVSRTEANQSSGSAKSSSLQDPSSLSKPSNMASFVASSNASSSIPSSSSSYGGVSGGGNMYNRPSLHTQLPASPYPSPYSAANSADLQDKSLPEQRQQQNSKLAQRARLPPPSKIPESAVEMPGDSVGALEIQFGGLHFTDSLDFTAITTSETTFQNNAVNSMPLSNPSPSSLHSYSAVSSSYQLGSSTSSSISSPSSLFTASSSPHPSSILNKESLLLSSSPQSKAANFTSVPRPLSTSSTSTLEGSNKSASDLPSFYSSQKLASTVLQSPSQGIGFGNNGTPLYSTSPASSSSSNIASSSASYQTSSSGLSNYNSSAANTEYNSSALASSVYSANNSAGVAGTGSVQSSQQQILNRLPDQQPSLGPSPQGSYGDSNNSQPPPPSQLQSIPSASSNSTMNSNSSAQGLPTVPTSVLKSGASSVLPPPPPAAGSTGNTKNYLPPGVPAATPALMTPQYIMGQAPPPSLSFYGYYDVPLTNVAAGRDLSSLQYTNTGTASGNNTDTSSKYCTRGSGSGNGSGDSDQQQQSSNTVSSSQQQTSTFLNPPTGPPTAIPPGYGYYIHGGMMTPHYPTPFFSVHQPSSAHGGATTTQFQKPTAYGSHSFNSVSYESLNAQSQDFLKGSYASTSQGKSVSGTDLTGSMYNKGNAAMLTKTFDKSAFQGSPHQFGMATAAPTANTQSPYSFIPVLPQHHSLMHLTRQDSPATAASSVAAANQSKVKPAGYPAAAAAATYWNN